jgi:type II restriction enzyme
LGRTLDVLNVVRAINKVEFSLDDVYAIAPHLEKLHSDNRHVRDKIGQQVQIMGDLGLIAFLGRARYHGL